MYFKLNVMWLYMSFILHIDCYRLPLSVFSFEFTAIFIATTNELNYFRYTAGKHCLKYIYIYSTQTNIGKLTD